MGFRLSNRNKVCIFACIALLVIVITAIWAYRNRDWFYETVPYYGSSECSYVRSVDKVVTDTYSTGGYRYREGDYVDSGGSFFRFHEGMELEYIMNTTIQKGAFKVAMYDLGKTYDTSEPLRDHLSEETKVYEKEFTESGSYQLDFSMLEPDTYYVLMYFDRLGDGEAYSYRATDRFYIKRWQYLYDKYIGSLPFFEPKYGGCDM